jgi:hypothetical protein
MEYQTTAFILSAIDSDLDCPWLDVRFETDDFEKLCRCAEIDLAKDPQFYRGYLLPSTTVATICEAFSIQFEHGSREAFLRKHTVRGPEIPYLVHTGYELALMVQGRKPYAFIEFDSANPRSATRKMRFDAYVAKGVLHSHEEIFDVEGQPGRRMGQTFYAVIGEEWRIPAFEFIRQNINSQGDGFENLERLEGALLGYERWQNDWWIDHLAKRNTALYGTPLVCQLNRLQYEWLVHAAFRALPPFDAKTIKLHLHRSLDATAMKQAIESDPQIEAFVQFNVGLRHIMHTADFRTAGPHEIPASLIPTINQHLIRTVRVLIQRAKTSKPD